MIFAAVASDGIVMPPRFIETCLKINAEKFLKILKDVLLPWTRRNFDLNQVMLIQESAPAHCAKQVQDFLKKIFLHFVLKNVWPSCCWIDLNARSYYLFGAIEQVSNATPHLNLVF